MTVNAFAGYVLVDSAGVHWPIASNTATAFTLTAGGATPASGAYVVAYSERSFPLVPGVDYAFNRSKGDLEVTFDLAQHDSIVAASDDSSPSVGAYTYSLGLGAEVQRAVNGDPSDFADYPGLRVTGTQILVVAPTTISPTFFLNVLPKETSSISALRPLVVQVVQAYVNSLGIGDEVILSEIVSRVQQIPGVYSVAVLEPQSNVPVADGQLARITADDVEVS
jgi:hypothetical protein